MLAARRKRRPYKSNAVVFVGRPLADRRPPLVVPASLGVEFVVNKQGEHMRFTDQMWAENTTIYEAILEHPFNRELGEGTLSAERFAYYVQQDSLYLRDYARALALLAAKAPTSDEAKDLLAYARDGIEVEKALHGHFFSLFGITAAEEQEPACFAYTQFLLSRVALEPYAVGLAAVLPCFWIYREVGVWIAGCAARPNPYTPWIETYSDEAFGRAVQRMLDITDLAAEMSSDSVRAAMREAFTHSTRCEWMFWDAAYRLERWPVR